MRFAERFLVVFALISIVMRLWGLKDGPTLELIALPALALFYLLMMPFLLNVVRKPQNGARAWGRILISVLCGLGMAYCIISLLLYTLGWGDVGKADMLVNGGIILGLLIIAGLIGWRKKRFYAMAGLRAAILLAAILAISLLPLPAISNLSRAAF
jgi:hypothetical protein